MLDAGEIDFDIVTHDGVAHVHGTIPDAIRNAGYRSTGGSPGRGGFIRFPRDRSRMTEHASEAHVRSIEMAELVRDTR